MKYFGGCDVGSTYTKTVILDENGAIVAANTIKSKINSAQSAKAGLDQAIADAGLKEISDLTYLIGTGYGRNKVPQADENISEISLVFLGRLIYGKDARKVRYVQNMEQTIQELSCDVKELQFYFFPKTPCRSSKCILQTPRLFVLPTPVSMQRSFHQNPPKGRSDASGPITWYCKI